MYITLNTTFFIWLIIAIGFVVSLIIVLLLTVYKYRNLLGKYNSSKKYFLQKANQVSMIEYHYRNYKEGTNAFTVLRNIGEILQYDSMEAKSKNDRR